MSEHTITVRHDIEEFQYGETTTTTFAHMDLGDLGEYTGAAKRYWKDPERTDIGAALALSRMFRKAADELAELALVGVDINDLLRGTRFALRNGTEGARWDFSDTFFAFEDRDSVILEEATSE